MSKGRLLYWVAALGAIALAFELVTGLVMWFAVPGGQGPRFGRRADANSFAAIDRSLWIDMHDWAGLVLVAVLILHLALHWRWVVRQTRSLISS
jgi:hypothetical protein